MSPFIRSSKFSRNLSIAALLLTLLFSGLSLNAQTPSCSVTTSTIPTVHAEGYTEQVADFIYTCSGGVAGTNTPLILFAAISTNVTNRVDANGIPMGLTITGSPGVFLSGLSLYAASTVELSTVSYTVPSSPSTPITITISGIRAAAATVANSTSALPSINGSALIIGANFTAPSSFPVAYLAPTLLSSNINDGIPCGGSPLPPSLDFPTFLATGTSVSAIRLTEASPAAFSVKTAGADTGLRILVKLSGYTPGARVFVPDALVGADPGATPTSGGLYGVPPSAGVYTPISNQLLLLRVNGADATGAGGSFALAVPQATYAFSSISEILVPGGAGYAVYEVVDQNPNSVENVQLPVWVVNPQTSCTATIPQATFSPMIAPVSTVSIATQTDPIPRFMATVPMTDCSTEGDCSAGYFPTLTDDTTSLTFTANSLGVSQQATINVGNSGGGLLSYTLAVTYQTSPSGWLTITPTSGQNTGAIMVTASPATLGQGTYSATITITAGSQSLQIPVTFNVGPVGVTVLNVGNAASFQYGTVAPGSYAVIFGMNLLGNVTTVAFNGVGATIVYKSATQINVLVPTNLTNTTASVVVTADGMVSNPFRVTLANFPGIFSNGVVNVSDGQSNVQSDPVTRGNFLSIYLTGLIMPLTGPVTVNIGSQMNLMPSFAGVQGTFSGLDQVNVMVPLSLPPSPNPVPLTVCIPGGTGQVCSNPISVYIQ
jgi:uncharacterized protein (TIGR03437 family)